LLPLRYSDKNPAAKTPAKPGELAINRNAITLSSAGPFAQLARKETPFGFVHTDDGAVRPPSANRPAFGAK